MQIQAVGQPEIVAIAPEPAQQSVLGDQRAALAGNRSILSSTCGLRRSDVHLLLDSRRLGCQIERAHLHVVRRADNPNGAWAKSRRERVVPLDFLVVQAFDTYEFERMRVRGPPTATSVFVNLFRGRIGAPMRPDAVAEQVDEHRVAAGRARHPVRRINCGMPSAATPSTPEPASTWSPTSWDMPRSAPRRSMCIRTPPVDAVPSPRDSGAVHR